MDLDLDPYKHHNKKCLTALQSTTVPAAVCTGALWTSLHRVTI